jgi:hypothetical protein
MNPQDIARAGQRRSQMQWQKLNQKSKLELLRYKRALRKKRQLEECVERLKREVEVKQIEAARLHNEEEMKKLVIVRRSYARIT